MATSSAGGHSPGGLRRGSPHGTAARVARLLLNYPRSSHSTPPGNVSMAKDEPVLHALGLRQLRHVPGHDGGILSPTRIEKDQVVGREIHSADLFQNDDLAHICIQGSLRCFLAVMSAWFSRAQNSRDHNGHFPMRSYTRLLRRNRSRWLPEVLRIVHVSTTSE